MDKKTNKFDEFEAVETIEKDGKYVLRLFVAGINPKSKKAIENLRDVCEEYLEEQYELEIIDIYQQPIFAKEGKIVGDLSDKKKLLLGLDLRSPKK